MSDELLPCPFCGGNAELWRAHENRPAWVACMGRCAVIVTREHKTDADAVAAWNRRALPAAGPAEDVRADERATAYRTGMDIGREIALNDAASACQRIAGNTRDFNAAHRRAAGQCAAMILALIPEAKP